MLKTRIIPVLLLEKGRLVCTKRFDQRMDVGSPITTAKFYNSQSADELVFLDIASDGDQIIRLKKVLSEVNRECFIPLAAGGGIRTLDDIETLLKAGADKIVLNTQAVFEPKFIQSASKRFGRQCIVVSCDYAMAEDGPRIFLKGYTDKLPLMDHLKRCLDQEPGEILLTSVDRNGSKQGYDLEVLKQTVEISTVPVIAFGGVGSLNHFSQGIKAGGASAVAASTFFHFTDQNLIKVRSFLKNQGINVR